MLRLKARSCDKSICRLLKYAVLLRLLLLLLLLPPPNSDCSNSQETSQETRRT
jgi:hypothetical protein